MKTKVKAPVRRSPKGGAGSSGGAKAEARSLKPALIDLARPKTLGQLIALGLEAERKKMSRRQRSWRVL